MELGHHCREPGLKSTDGGCVLENQQDPGADGDYGAREKKGS